MFYNTEAWKRRIEEAAQERFRPFPTAEEFLSRIKVQKPEEKKAKATK